MSPVAVSWPRGRRSGDIAHYKHSTNLIAGGMCGVVEIGLLYISATMPTTIVLISLGIMCICLSERCRLGICCMSGVGERHLRACTVLHHS